MAKRINKQNDLLQANKGEQAMIEAILEGSPEGIGVAVIRLDCGCIKMAAVNPAGDPASKVIMYRDNAESICEQCKADNGDFMRVKKQFISWQNPEPDTHTKQMIINKVLGSES
ncbi:hypothetical protein [Desulfogranum marinum]|jgi:hypothetical protein|uniref:hypothetical protein n=1 Tax=Desulfogranum marinum TaxID=453220 RepID=UPI00196331C8|nr:hypothetical protein [Desulfogranum marinum]MBM9513118.1 hypothetical protein [Desulfogranum marinum]